MWRHPEAGSSQVLSQSSKGQWTIALALSSGERLLKDEVMVSSRVRDTQEEGGHALSVHVSLEVGVLAGLVLAARMCARIFPSVVKGQSAQCARIQVRIG